MGEFKIRVGSKVAYRGDFGSGSQQIAVVKCIEVTEFPRQKYGHEVKSVDIHAHYVLTLDNGHWCFSHQVDYVVSEEAEGGEPL